MDGSRSIQKKIIIKRAVFSKADMISFAKYYHTKHWSVNGSRNFNAKNVLNEWKVFNKPA